jgi:hypothetical protein
MDYTDIIGRRGMSEEISNLLRTIISNIHDPMQKRCIFVFGDTGVGKTTFVKRLCKDEGYDMIDYGNSSGVSSGSSVKMSNIISKVVGTTSVYSMFFKKKPVVAYIDDIGIGTSTVNSDNSKISQLIKMVRPKRTKKQLSNDDTVNMPVICISGRHHNKKITELIKMSYVFECKTPTEYEYTDILGKLGLPVGDSCGINMHIIDKMVRNSDANSMLRTDECNSVAFERDQGNDTHVDEIVVRALNDPITFEDYDNITNDVDRTVVGMNIHENASNDMKFHEDSVVMYERFLDHFVISDFIDRGIFQKQLWQLSDISAILKIASVHETHPISMTKNKSVRFTKILTKYSSEYSNQLFLQKLCNELHLNTRHVFEYFNSAFEKHTIAEITEMLKDTDVSKLDVARMGRFMKTCGVESEWII